MYDYCKWLLFCLLLSIILVILTPPEHSHLNPNRLLTEYKEILQRVVTALPNPSLIPLVQINRPPQTQKQLASTEVLKLAKSLPSSIGVVNQLYKLHERILEIMRLYGPAESSFELAIRGIDEATITLISEISLFILEIDSNRICAATTTLHRIIMVTHDLLSKLENALSNIESLQFNVIQLHDDLTVVRLDVSKEERGIKRKEAELKNQYFPNKAKLNQMEESSVSLSSIERVVGELKSSSQTAENRITEAIRHLKSSSVRMKEIFVDTVYHENTAYPSLSSCFQWDRLLFNSNQRKEIIQAGEVVYNQLKEAKKNNEKVIEKISVYGFDAISE